MYVNYDLAIALLYYKFSGFDLVLIYCNVFLGL